MKIAVDAMGGDHAPGVVVEGALAAVRELGAEVILVGPRERVRAELTRLGGDLEVADAPQVVEMGESPVLALRNKPESSIRVGLEMVRRGDADAFVSAGNTGAVMSTATRVLGRLRGVDRPAIVTRFPTTGAGETLLLDAGANPTCKATQLVEFAFMGATYAEHVLGRSSPRVGVLSNGEEEGKGTDLTRETHELLGKSRLLSYVGYVEGRDLFDGSVDVAVCDGFVGNVVLKACEGLAGAVRAVLDRELRSSWRGKLAYLVGKPAFGAIRKSFDHHEFGGAPLLGVSKVCIISHGSATARAIRNAVREAMTVVREDVTGRIARALEQSPVLAEARAVAADQRRDRAARRRAESNAGRASSDAGPEASDGPDPGLP